MYLSHTKTLVLAGEDIPLLLTALGELKEGKKNSTLFFVGAIIANYFKNFFYAISSYGGWVMTI